MTASATTEKTDLSLPAPISPHPVMVTITLLMVIGVVMVYSALAGMEGPQEGTAWYKLTSFRSMMFAPAAFAVMLIMSRLPYRKLDSKLIWVMAGLCVLMLVCVYLPGIGVEKNLRRRWIKIPGLPDELNLGFQPSEIAKFGLVVFLAWWLGRRGSQPESFTRGFLPAAGAIAVFAGIIAKEDLGTGVITGTVGFALLFVGGCRLWHPLTLVPLVLAGMFLVLDTTRMNRLLAYQKTDTRQFDTQGKDYQIWNSMLAIASGGVSGQGLGEGIQKLGRLPLKSSDFIFAHITEELGLVGGAAILSLYGLLLYQGGLIMTRARDRFGQLIAFGITFIFGMQAFIHAGVVTKVLPNKGINLPFVSAGGTGLIIMAAAGGLLAAVARGTAAARSTGAAACGLAVGAGSSPPLNTSGVAGGGTPPSDDAGGQAASGTRAGSGRRRSSDTGGQAAGGTRTPDQAATAALPEVHPEADPTGPMPAVAVGGRKGFDRAAFARMMGS